MTTTDMKFTYAELMAGDSDWCEEQDAREADRLALETGVSEAEKRGLYLAFPYAPSIGGTVGIIDRDQRELWSDEIYEAVNRAMSIAQVNYLRSRDYDVEYPE